MRVAQEGDKLWYVYSSAISFSGFFLTKRMDFGSVVRRMEDDAVERDVLILFVLGEDKRIHRILVKTCAV